MRFNFFTTLSVLSLIFTNASQGSTIYQTDNNVETLQALKWKHRVLLIDLSQVENKTILLEQLKLAKSELLERRLAIILLNETDTLVWNSDSNKATLANYEAEFLSTRLNGEQALLIGLDGGSKAIYSVVNSTLDLSRVYADIDGMPMRRAELN